MNNFLALGCAILVTSLSTVTMAQNCFNSRDQLYISEARQCNSKSAALTREADATDPLSIKIAGRSLLECVADMRASARQSEHPVLRRFLRDMADASEPLGEVYIAIGALNEALRDGSTRALTEIARSLVTRDALSLLAPATSLAALQTRREQAIDLSRRVYPFAMSARRSAIQAFNSADVPNCN